MGQVAWRLVLSSGANGVTLHMLSYAKGSGQGLPTLSGWGFIFKALVEHKAKDFSCPGLVEEYTLFWFSALATRF